MIFVYFFWQMTVQLENEAHVVFEEEILEF